VAPLGELPLAHVHGGQHGGGEVGRDRGVLQGRELRGEKRVSGEGGRALGAGVAVLVGLEALRTAQRAVGQALEGAVVEVVHERCSASCALSSLRARWSQVITVPIGTASVSAISA
jgi:hypothetical protein